MRRSAELLALLGVVVADAVLLLGLRHKVADFDEGVYLLSLDALRAGESLGDEVWAPQPPAFYAVLRAAGALFGTGLENVRLGFVTLACLGVAAAWAFARIAASALAGVLAAALVAVAPPVPLFGARVLADLPSLWLAVAALGAAGAAQRAGRARIVLAATAGALVALSALVKLSALLVLPFAVVVLVRRGTRACLTAAAAGAAAVTASFVLAHARSLDELWRSAVSYHSAARDSPAVIDRWDAIADVFLLRTPFTWLAAGALALMAFRLLDRRVGLLEAVAWGWAAASFAFVAVHHPLHENHLVALSVPLALATAVTLGHAVARLTPRARFAVAVGLVAVVAVAWVQQTRRVEIVPGYNSLDVALAHALDERTSRGALVVTDRPVAAVFAGRRVPGNLVDPAYLRFETGYLTPDEVVRTIDERCVAAVVVARAFLGLPRILAALPARFRAAVKVGDGRIWTERRRACAR